MAYRPVSNYWDDLPIICGSMRCLDGNPYTPRMTKAGYDKCEMCSRPFAVWRWKPRHNARYKKETKICKTCCMLNNACQICLSDLGNGLTVDQFGDTEGDGVAAGRERETDEDRISRLCFEMRTARRRHCEIRKNYREGSTIACKERK